MAFWKRLFAKEWLIFLTSFGAGALLLGYAAPFVANTTIAIKYDMDKNKYQEQLKEYVQNNLHDWKPQTGTKTSEEEGIEYVGPLDPNNPTDYDIRMSIISIYKQMHPEYATLSNIELEKKLPPWAYYYSKSPPLFPKVPTFYNYYPLRLAILMGFIFYGIVVLIRSTTWAVKYLKKEDIN